MPDTKLSLLRRILRTFGLSSDSVESVVEIVSSHIESPNVDANLKLPYVVRDKFMNDSELRFYHFLTQVVGDKAVILCKVNLRDVIKVSSSDKSESQVLTNKIDRKHVDYLLCDRNTIRPLCAIELDGSSHQRSDRVLRDNFVDNVFRSANLPLLRFPVSDTYSQGDFKELLSQYIDSVESVRCPKCGNVMVIRTSKRGENAGNKFWGCLSYPKCRTVLEYRQDSISDRSNEF